MIEFKNWILTGDGLLARQYDNLSRRVEVVGDLPEGWEWELLVQVGDAMDIIRLSPMEGGVGHTLTAEQVSIPGYYTAQLRGRQGEVIRHTNTVQCFVSKSLSGDAKWPELPSEFSQAEERIAELNAHPPKPGTNGFWMLWDADRDEYVESDIPMPDGAGNVLLAVGVDPDGGSMSESFATILDHLEHGGLVQFFAAIPDKNADGDEYATPDVITFQPTGWIYSENQLVFLGMFAVQAIVLILTRDNEITVESFDLQGSEGPQGPPGEPGPAGPAGADGYTPVKGVDYWTQEDKREIVNEVLADLPAAEGVGF